MQFYPAEKKKKKIPIRDDMKDCMIGNTLIDFGTVASVN